MPLPLIILGAIIVLLLVLNWLVAWRKNETDTNRGLETWQGWDDGHGAGGGGI